MKRPMPSFVLPINLTGPFSHLHTKLECLLFFCNNAGESYQWNLFVSKVNVFSGVFIAVCIGLKQGRRFLLVLGLFV